VLVAAVVAYNGPSTFEASGFQLNAIFTSDAQLSLHSPVRMAGVPVGSVTGEQPLGGDSNAVVVTMSIAANGLPVHTDATAQIRPRLVLEGNFYIDLHPGTPGARILRTGQTLSASQTSGPVQIDRVLSSLDRNTRSDLQRLVQGFGSALGGEGPSGSAPEDPRTVGKTAGQALHDGLLYSAPALRDLALTTTALQGSRPGDLSDLIAGSSRVFGALAGEQSHLASLIANFNTTMAAFAVQQHNLGQTVALLPGFLERAGAADQRVEVAIPPTRAFARAIVPGLRQLPATISTGSPFITQAQLLLARDDLGGLVDSLTPAVRDTAQAVSAGRPLLSALDLLDRCLVRNAIPTADQTISDPPLQSGGTVWQEALQGLVGIVSASQNFDGNGYYLRGQTAGGPYSQVTSTVPQLGPLRGNAVLPPLGTRPAWPGHQPPITTDVACAREPAPNLNSARTGGTP
jgi:ABC-type transporter Mla subunit MlaD